MKSHIAFCCRVTTAVFAIAGFSGCATTDSVKSKAPVMAEVLAASQPSDWRALDPENTLYLELATGRVVIELAPEFAPRHVANVKALAREHYYDGLAIIRAQDNYVVQWGDPNAEKPELARKIHKAQRTLPAEFDRPIHPAKGDGENGGKNVFFTRLPDGDVYADRTFSSTPGSQ
jgi:hypothetical protein